MLKSYFFLLFFVSCTFCSGTVSTDPTSCISIKVKWLILYVSPITSLFVLFFILLSGPRWLKLKSQSLVEESLRPCSLCFIISSLIEGLPQDGKQITNAQSPSSAKTFTIINKIYNYHQLHRRPTSESCVNLPQNTFSL